jgi:hypothetical protein
MHRVESLLAPSCHVRIKRFDAEFVIGYRESLTQKHEEPENTIRDNKKARHSSWG